MNPALFPELAGIGYWENKIDGSITWSEELYRIFELAPETIQLTFENVISLFHPDDRHIFTDTAMLAAHAEGSADYESRILMPDGRIKWLLQRIRYVKDAHGNFERVTGAAIDITARKADEVALHYRSALLETINQVMAVLLEEDEWVAILKRAFVLIGNTISLDRVFYYENAVDEADNIVYATRVVEWLKDGINEIDHPLFRRFPFEWADAAMERKLSAGKAFWATIGSLPEGDMRTFMTIQGVRSFVLFPVMLRGTVKGFIGFHVCGEERQWLADELYFLQSLTANMALVLEKRVTNKELQDKKQQLKSVINNLPGITYRAVFDTRCKLVFVSNEMERLTGYPATMFTQEPGLSYCDIIHPNDLPARQLRMLEINTIDHFEIEYRLITSNKKTIWVRERARGTFDNNGHLTCIDGVIIDITETKAKEQRIKLNNKRFRLVLKATREAVIDWDIVSGKTIWGDGFQTLFGYDLKANNDGLWQENIHPDDKQRVMAELVAALKDRNVSEFSSDFRFYTADRRIATVQLRGIFVRKRNGTAVRGVGSIIDLTAALEQSLRLQLQHQQLQRISWMQSHMVRAPLANMLGLTDLLRTGNYEELTQEQLQDALYDEARKLDKVIREVVNTTDKNVQVV